MGNSSVDQRVGDTNCDEEMTSDCGDLQITISFTSPTAVAKKIEPPFLKSFRQWLAQPNLAPHSHNAGTILLHQKR